MLRRGGTDVSDAIAVLRADLSALPPVRLPLPEALGRVLAEEVVAAADHPNADLSAFDGLACRVADSLEATPERPLRLRLRGEVGAGDPAHPGLSAGEACLVYTGAVLPPGADGVVPLEAMRREGDDAWLLQPASAAMLRRRASSWRAGQPLLRVGERLDAVKLALAATAGRDRLLLRPAPKVVVVCTGAELHPLGSLDLPPGHHVESNGLAISLAARQAGAELLRVERLDDDPSTLRRSLDAAAQDADLVLCSGGSAHSERDHLRRLMAGEGELLLQRLAMRPGGPSLYGRWRGTPLLGLPGRPLGTMVAFLLLAQPAITALEGGPETAPFHLRRPALSRQRLPAAAHLPSLVPVTLRRQGEQLEARLPDAGAAAGADPEQWPAAANALALVPAGRDVQPGTPVEVIPSRPGQPVSDLV